MTGCYNPHCGFIISIPKFRIHEARFTCPIHSITIPLYLEKWWRASSFFALLEFSKTKQRGGGTEQQQQIYQFTQGYNILHRLQVHHLSLIFIIHNKYIFMNNIFIYIHISIVIVNFINDNAFY